MTAHEPISSDTGARNMKEWWVWLRQKGPVPGEIDEQYNWSEMLLIAMPLAVPVGLIALAYCYLLGWIR